ncbi:MAG TPA: cyclic nucleotide-binding domain-containing protein [Polyangiaceae bacterium]|nr:cyclic nucleotide-binding domain-containing protein [Polyangiaceae bacterium]
METENLARALAEHPFCKDMRPDDIEFLSGCAKNARFAEGEFLAREGDAADTLLLLRKGNVALEVHVPGRGDRQLETVGPGEVLGWSALFPPHTWHLDLRALTPCLVFAIDGVCLRKKVEGDHSFGYLVTRLLLMRVHARLERARLAQLDLLAAENS